MSQSPTDSTRTRLLAQRLNGLSKLVDLTCRLAAEQDLDRILTLITTEVCQALSCERASLFRYDPETRELVTRVVTELEIAEIRHSVDVGITGWVARHREIANISDPSVDPRWLPHVDRETGFRTECILAAPLISIHEGRMLGVLELLNKQGGQFSEFDEHLVQAFAAHAAVALERAQLVENLRRTQMLEASIALARDIQASFLPSKLPELPGYELAAWWQPAEGVGGDYYDVMELSDGRLALAVGDVSGHGIGPSLIMASARAMLHILTRTASEPEKILNLLAQSIAPDLKEGRFITFFLGALDTQVHRFSFANSGHAPALYFCSRTREFRRLRSTGLPLGVAPERPIHRGEDIDLLPGDILLLATDGAIEQHNEAWEMFGLQRLQDLIEIHSHLPAGEILQRLREGIQGFYRDSHPDDDVTLLLVRRVDR